MKFRQDGSWTKGRLKARQNGQWVNIETESGGSSKGTNSDGGFSWDQTFTDTSWVADAGDDLNIERVTTLDSTGSGSITEAIENAADQPSVIVFEVGGVIELDPSEELRIRSPDLWIAGETAPDPGIAITRGMVRIHQPRTILSHVSVLVGDGTESESDGLVIDADDVMVDHCTVAWGTDENAGASNAVARGSFINSIIAEALYDSIHPEGRHSRGLLINDADSTDLAVMGCVFSHSNRRHPMTRGDMVIANNYTYNYGGQMVHFDGDSNPDITAVGLLFEDGNNSDSDVPVFLYGADVYADDVVTDPDDHPLTDSSTELVDTAKTVPSGLDLEQDIVPTSDLKEHLLTRVGPRPAQRPAIESGILSRLNDDYDFVDSQDDVDGYPSYTEATRTLDIPNTGLVEWLQEVKRTVEVSQ